MNKGELIKEVKTKFDVGTSAAVAIVENFTDILKAALINDKEITLPEIGKLKIKSRPARQGRNPRTGETIQIPAKDVVKFTPSSEFKGKLTGV